MYVGITADQQQTPPSPTGGVWVAKRRVEVYFYRMSVNLRRRMNRQRMTEDSPQLQPLIGRVIVLDVAAAYVYVGTLREFDHRYLVLADADVHDLRDTTTTRDLYVLEARRHGVNVNRRGVLVNRDQVVSLSALEDVAE